MGTVTDEINALQWHWLLTEVFFLRKTTFQLSLQIAEVANHNFRARKKGQQGPRFCFQEVQNYLQAKAFILFKLFGHVKQWKQS